MAIDIQKVKRDIARTEREIVKGRAAGHDVSQHVEEVRWLVDLRQTARRKTATGTRPAGSNPPPADFADGYKKAGR